MFKNPILFLIFTILNGCAARQFQEQDARYTKGQSGALPTPETGEVLVRASTNYQRSKLHQLIWGKHYREVWAAPVLVPVLDLDQRPLPLKPQKMGGGLQTTSLSLLDPKGRTYTLRTLEKDPAKSLSPRLKKTFVSNIMRDQTSAINPYAAFTVPPLAEAAGVFHTNPKPYYVSPAVTDLGEYNAGFAGKLTMLEEKYENVVDIAPAFGPVTEVIKTEELFNRLKTFNNHQVDQFAMARARLLDIILGDWDRHEGQWTWAQYNQEPGWYQYKPLPKDRDYAYYRYQDGALTWLLSRRLLFGKIKPFIHNIPDVGGLIYKGRELDKQMLNKLSAKEWQVIATDMQAALTYQVLQKALHNFPDTVYKLEGENTLRYLQKKIKNLPQIADEYYKILARDVSVMGSDEKEKFVVSRLPGKRTLIQSFTVPAVPGDSAHLLYQRVFIPKETKKIKLDGLGSADEYVLQGKARRGPKVHLLVNTQLDTITGKAGAKKVKIINKKEEKS